MLRPLPRSLLVLLLLSLVAVVPAAAAPIGNAAFQRTWDRTDRPVAEVRVDRTWMWGPEANTGLVTEPFVEAPGGQRTVQYFDKSRMEITNPEGDQTSIWYVTNGLLAVELISGRMQIGENTFDQRSPSQANISGDPADSTAPTYASLSGLLTVPTRAVGTVIVQRVDRNGVVTDDPGLAGQGVTVAFIDTATQHSVAKPFWDFMNSAGLVYENGQYREARLFENPIYATGRPITEAYWAKVKVAGIDQNVLLQCFERRCLTYTPGNAPGWRVEAGNVGQHYYAWRYPQPGTGTWSSTGSMSTARRSHTATLLQDGSVLVTGGQSIGDGTATAERYNPATGRWSSTGRMSTARWYHTATLLQDGSVLVAGGYSTGDDDAVTAERYNPATGRWNSTGSMSTPRGFHTATRLQDGSVLVTGGYSTSGDVRLATAERYNPATGRWSNTGNMSIPRYAHTATRLRDGSVLVAGGYTTDEVAMTAERYNQATGTWSGVSSMSMARQSHTATLLQDGSVLVVGGGIAASAERYNPTAGTWSSIGSLSTAPRHRHTATLLQDGSVLVAGGYSTSGIEATAERYNPATGRWSHTGSMSTPRYDHTATRLRDGSVLAAAGYTTNDVVGATAELYSP